MAFLDNALILSNAQALTVTANATNVYDITGYGSGVVPSMVWGTSAAIGADMGAGDGLAIPYLYMTVGTAGTGTGTLTVTLAAAPDNGSGSAGTYTTIYSSAAYVGNTLLKGASLLAPVPPVSLSNVYTESLPRFYRVTYTISGSLTATVTTSILINPPTGFISTLYPNNFQAA